jgi:DNA-binding transcriptional regulator YiaG
MRHDTEELRKGGLDVLDRAERRVLDEYDATTLVGLRTIVTKAAIEHRNGDEVSIELPRLPQLMAAASVFRCLMAPKLRGHEIKAMRRVMDLTLAEMAARMGGRTAPQTVCRWETEAQPMGAYAEKVFRLVVCEALTNDAPGVEYHAAMLADLAITDRWDAHEDPVIQLCYMPMKQGSGVITDAYNAKRAA